MANREYSNKIVNFNLKIVQFFIFVAEKLQNWRIIYKCLFFNFSFMRTANEVRLRGFVSEKPQLKMTTSQKKVVNIVLITHKRKMDNGTAYTEPDFHRVTLWQGLAEVAEKFLTKGSIIEITGEIHNDQYKDKEGKTNYTHEITADNLDIIAVKNDKGYEVFIPKGEELEEKQEKK